MVYGYGIFHIPSKLCISMTLEVFKVYTLVGGELWNHEMNLKYIVMGFDLVDSGRQGGDFNDYWEAWERCLKCWVGFVIISFRWWRFVVSCFMVRFVITLLRNQQYFMLF